MNNYEIRFEGTKDELLKFRDELISNNDNNQYIIKNLEEEQLDPLSRPQQGMEPLTYFIVAFSAHLSADIVKSGLDKLIKKAKEKNIITKNR